jgi:voltage-gated sodium channel
VEGFGVDLADDIPQRAAHGMAKEDAAVLALFEFLMKFVVERLSFFSSAWNVFDFFIVGISLVPGTGQFPVLRSLRILRAMRLITKLSKLMVIVESIIRALF